MTDNAVECRQITKRFRSADGADVVALRGVDLTVKVGEFLMLVGPSGCGKTTLISVIAGMLAADGGTCEVLGEDIGRMRPAEKLAFRGRNLGFIFQSFNLLPALSVAENVAVPLIINRVPHAQAVQKAQAMLEYVGLGNRANDRPGQLSGGQQQRVAIARALVHDPKIVLCDEPTSALDHETGGQVLELMRGMNCTRGTTLIIVTHDNRIFHYAQRIAHMDDGRIDRVYTGDETQHYTAHAEKMGATL